MIPPGKKKKIIIGAVAGITICVCFLVWSSYRSHASQTKRGDEETVTLVRTAVIVPMDADKRYVYAGDVCGRHESQLAFQIGGKIINRRVELGTAVRPGQVLMEIDTKDIGQVVNAQQAQVAQASSQLQLAEKDMKRYSSLFEQGVVSRSQFEQITCAYDVARARLEQAQAQYKHSANQFGYTKLGADAAGVVSAVTAEVGQVVGPGQVVVTVVRDGEREVEISVPENRIDAVRISSRAQITFWALPGLTLEGRIREIAPMADAAVRTYKVRVTILKPTDQIRLGMTASVRISDPNGKTAMPSIPLSALYQTEDTPQVWVVQNGSVHLLPIKTGEFDNDQIQVLSGLKGGDVIVTAGVHKLREGQKVKAVAGEKR